LDIGIYLRFVIWDLSFFGLMEIIPTIIAKDFSEVQEKIKRAEPFFDWLQLDIMDGKFVANKTWQQSEDLIKIKTKLKLEAHLMVAHPERVVDDWLAAGVQRIIVHWEAVVQAGAETQHISYLQKIIDQVKSQQKEFGLALNPETPVDMLADWLLQTDLVLLMTVNPGQGGQDFMPKVIPKITQLRQIWPDGKISVDGGIDLEFAKQCSQAGANVLSVGSALWRADSLEQMAGLFKKI